MKSTERGITVATYLPLRPEESAPCDFPHILKPYFWLTVQEDIETLRNPLSPRDSFVDVDIKHSKRYRAIRAEVAVEEHLLPFSLILVYAPLFSDRQEYQWLGLHEKIFMNKGTTFHDVEVERVG